MRPTATLPHAVPLTLAARLKLAAQANALPAVASLAYLALGWLWITMSDQIGELLFSSAEQLTRYQTYKGAGFVVASAALIYWLMGSARGRRPARQPAGPASGRWPLRVML